MVKGRDAVNVRAIAPALTGELRSSLGQDVERESF